MRDVLAPTAIGPIEGAEGYGPGDDPGDVSDVRFFVPRYMNEASSIEWIARMPQLQVVQLLTAGYESAMPHIRPGITLCNAVGVHDASTAELAVGLILASQRGIDDAARDMSSARWDHRTRPSLADRRVLVIGAGGVGQAIRRRLESFECEVTLVGRTARAGVHGIDELRGLLAAAEIVVLAVPLDESTAGLVDAAFLARLPRGALVVNVARGPVVVTDDLVAALASGRIRAALDVTDPEPLPVDHPLWHVPGCLITPHLGGDTSAFAPRARRLVTDQVERWRTGRPLRGVVSG